MVGWFLSLALDSLKTDTEFVQTGMARSGKITLPSDLNKERIVLFH